MKYPRYFVQGETVRGEPRVYWVEERRAPGGTTTMTGKYTKRVTDVTRDRRTAQRWCDKLLAAPATND